MSDGSHNPSGKPRGILLVGQHPTVQGLREVLPKASTCRDCSVQFAPDFSTAEAFLQAQRWDVLLTAEKLPNPADGFAGLKQLAAQHPGSFPKTVVFTEGSALESLTRSFSTTQLLPSTTPETEILQVIHHLLHPEAAFGLAPYLAPGTPLRHQTITGTGEISHVFAELRGFLEAHGVEDVDELCIALVEAVTNGIYHVPRTENGALKYQKGQVIEALAPGEQVFLSYGADDRQVGIAIADQGGAMTPAQVHYWLERNLSEAGLLDTHGRGLYLMHTLADRLMINIHPGVRTEMVLLKGFQPSPQGEAKPLRINLREGFLSLRQHKP